MHHFLLGGFLENARGGFIPGGAAELGELAVFNVRHRFAGKGGFKVFDRGGGGLTHGLSPLDVKNVLNTL
jgi:hypothetical protein